MNYDIIGDIHGHADALTALLKVLGYEERGGLWRHSERTAVFVGDFIDRGPKQLEVISIVRPMVEEQTAVAVMGNHELNAIAWYLHHPRSSRTHLRTHTGKRGMRNFRQHRAFIDAVSSRPGLHKNIVDWFLTLPLWLDLDEIRAVHACWHSGFIDFLQPKLLAGNRLSEDLMVHACREPKREALKDNAEPSIFKAVEVLTKGLETPLPASHSFVDKDEQVRKRIRLAWWNDAATTLGDASLPYPKRDEAWSECAIPAHCRIGYTESKPVFFGHYWLQGNPTQQSDKVACLDYSIAKGGKLCAYRWNHGDAKIGQEGFTWI